MANKIDEIRYCSFCGKSQHEVKRLIAGPKVHICNECVDLCADIIQDENAKVKTPKGKSEQDQTPEDIVAALDAHVISQDRAKKILAVGVYNHYLRVNNLANSNDLDKDVEIEKSNILLIGPTGSGKTLLAQTLARNLNVPFVIADATKITQAGYVGEDVETMLQKLLAACENNVDKAKHGIIYIDEIDKVALPRGGSIMGRDVNGEGVQTALLKIIEGTIALVPPAGGRKIPNQEFVQLDTRGILFIFGGAFSGLEKIVQSRSVGKGSIGFAAHIMAADAKASMEMLHKIEPEDLIRFGLIPELVGRIPVIASLDELTEHDLVRILTEPKSALVKQFAKLVSYNGAELVFTPEASIAIARKAKTKGSGARGLRTIIEGVLLEIQYLYPGIQKSGKRAKRIVIDADTVSSGKAPEFEY